VKLDTTTCRDRLRSARVAYLATAGADLRPHIVPVTAALIQDRLVTAVDLKPKTTVALRRLRNIAANPRVSVLCDHYADDWTRLWWVRADGSARLEEDAEQFEAAIAELAAKYPQYREQPPPGPVIAIDVDSWSGWSARADGS
jgi:PPOX class probable F420-dependent enzyme